MLTLLMWQIPAHNGGFLLIIPIWMLMRMVFPSQKVGIMVKTLASKFLV